MISGGWQKKQPGDWLRSGSLVRTMTKTARQVSRQARQLFRMCLADGMLDEELVRQVVEKVIASRRRGYFLLLSQFLRQVKLDRARRTAEVESAVPLPPDLQATVQTGLEDLYGKGINVLFAHRPELIGGMRIKVGSDVYDGSVQSRLAALEEKF